MEFIPCSSVLIVGLKIRVAQRDIKLCENIFKKPYNLAHKGHKSKS